MAAPEQDEFGWHRVCLNTIVRKGVALDSERLRILPMGSRVHVVEKRERRVRIDQPIEGWCSLKSSNGDTILKKLEQEDISISTPSAAQTMRKNMQDQIQNQRDIVSQAHHLTTELQNLKQQLNVQQDSLRQRDEVNEQVGLKNERNLEKEAEIRHQKTLASQLNDSLQEATDELKEAMQTKVEDLCAKYGVGSLEELELKEREENLRASEEEEKLNKLQQNYDECRRQNDTLEDQIKKMRENFETDPAVDEHNFVRLLASDKLLGGDVVLLKKETQLGMAVVRWSGKLIIDEQKPEGEDAVGLEFESQVFDTDHSGAYKGEQFFECRECLGGFVPSKFIKRRITPEELLGKLQKKQQELERLRSAKD